MAVLGKFYPSHSLKPWNLLSQMQTLGPQVYLQFHHFDRMPGHIHWDPPLTSVKAYGKLQGLFSASSYLIYISFSSDENWLIPSPMKLQWGGGDFLIHCKQKIRSFSIPLILLFPWWMLLLLVVMVLFSQLWENRVSKSSLK